MVFTHNKPTFTFVALDYTGSSQETLCYRLGLRALGHEVHVEPVLFYTNVTLTFNLFDLPLGHSSATVQFWWCWGRGGGEEFNGYFYLNSAF